MSMQPERGAGRHLMRFLRTVEAACGSARLEGPVEENYRISLRGRTMTFAKTVVDGCERDGLIARQGLKTTLTPEGVAALRRLQHPDAGYLAQHGGLSKRVIDTARGSEQVTVNDGESPLTRLFTR